MGVTLTVRHERTPRGVLATVLAVALALAACWREQSPSGPSGPLAVDRVMGRYSEREGPAGRSVTFDGAGGTTFSYRAGDGRVFTARGRYWFVGDAVKADYITERDSRFALFAVLRGDSLLLIFPSQPKPPPSMVPPLVCDRPD